MVVVVVVVVDVSDVAVDDVLRVGDVVVVVVEMRVTRVMQ